MHVSSSCLFVQLFVYSVHVVRCLFIRFIIYIHTHIYIYTYIHTYIYRVTSLAMCICTSTFCTPVSQMIILGAWSLHGRCIWYQGRELFLGFLDFGLRVRWVGSLGIRCVVVAWGREQYSVRNTQNPSHLIPQPQNSKPSSSNR